MCVLISLVSENSWEGILWATISFSWLGISIAIWEKPNIWVFPPYRLGNDDKWKQNNPKTKCQNTYYFIYP